MVPQRSLTVPRRLEFHRLLAVAAALVGVPALTGAEVVGDGSLGPPDAISAIPNEIGGTDYVIPPDHGSFGGSGTTNLFHRFGQFDLDSSERAVFTDGGITGIENVFGGITDFDASSIDGAIVSEIPNVYLFNPHGFLFGPNATLNLSGSFYASSADYVTFSDGGRFDVHALGGPSTLSVAEPVAFGFAGAMVPGAIAFDDTALAVEPGQTLGLIAGDITGAMRSNPDPPDISDRDPGSPAMLDAAGGRVEIASVASAGEVRLDSPADPLDVSSFDALGTVEFYGEFEPGALKSAIDVAGDPGGSVVLRAERFLLRDGAFVTAGTFGAADHPGTAVDIDVRGSVELLGHAGIGASSFGLGDAGDIEIRTGRLEMQGTPGVSNVNIGSRSFGAVEDGKMVGGGDGGVVRIEADEIALSDWAFIQTNTFSPGQGGNIQIDTGTLTLDAIRSNAFISASAAGPAPLDVPDGVAPGDFNPAGSGNAGNIDIRADRITLEGSLAGVGSIATQVREDALGNPNGGILTIDTGTLEVFGGAQLNSGVFAGGGRGGDIDVTADRVTLQGIAGDFSGFFSSGIFADVGSGVFFGTPARAGDIRVAAQTLEIHDGAVIGNSANFPSGGSGGDIFIDVETLDIRNSGSVQSNAFGLGSSGGQIDVRASTIRIAGPNEAPTIVGTGIFGQGGTGAVSPSSIKVEADVLELVDGGSVSTTTFGLVGGGSLDVSADQIRISGVDSGLDIPSQISSRSEISAFDPNADFEGGAGGDISIEGKSLKISDGGTVSSGTITGGDGGNIEIDVRQVWLANGGSISVSSTPDPRIPHASAPDPSTAGDAGDIHIRASDRIELRGGSIDASAEFSDGGNILIEARRVLDSRDGSISAAVGGGAGEGGNVIIDPQLVFLSRSEILASAVGGLGGNISITADALLADASSVIDASSQLGIDGNVEIKAPDTTITGQLAPLPDDTLNAASLLQEPCKAREEASGSFLIRGRDGVPPTPDGYLPAAPPSRDSDGASRIEWRGSPTFAYQSDCLY